MIKTATRAPATAAWFQLPARALALATALGMALAVAPLQAQDGAELKTQHDKVSYSIGLSVGRNLQKQSIEVDPDKFVLGLRDAMQGGEPMLSEEELREVMFAFQMERRAKQMEEHNKVADANKQRGEDFLAENKQRSGVKSTDSGLQYKVIEKGTGESPSLESTVTAHYKGTLIDGTEFDSSYSRGQPAEFPVNGVIEGWAEVLQLMKVGGKWRVWIPAELAYGEQGAGQRIGPNQMLIFEIELLGVE